MHIICIVKEVIEEMETKKKVISLYYNEKTGKSLVGILVDSDIQNYVVCTTMEPTIPILACKTESVFEKSELREAIAYMDREVSVDTQ